MKIVSITGSPRRGGTSFRISESFVKTALQKNAHIKEYHLNDLTFRGCQGCDACKKTSDKCVLKDDLSQVLSDLLDADIAVFSSPVYYGDTTGQFKMFTDRTWSFVGADYQSSRLGPGKKAVFITTQADMDTAHRDVTERYIRFLNLYGYEIETIRACGCGMEKNANIDEQAKAASQLADRLIT